MCLHDGARNWLTFEEHDLSLVERLKRNELLLGTLLSLPSPDVAELISKSGVDWLFIDGEHNPLSTLECQRLLQAVAGRCPSLIRVSENTEGAFKQALDAGADGIIAPRVNSAAEAEQIVRWCKYPPQGERSVGLARAHDFGLNFAEYMERANRDLAVVIQAEHIDAVDNIESIAEVEGVDAVFIGPYDLSASLHKIGQLDDPEVIAAIDRVTQVCQQGGMPLGIFCTTSASAKPYIERGFNLVCVNLDVGFIRQGVADLIEELK